MTSEKKQAIKQVPIRDILAERGLFPVRDNGSILLFQMPLGNDDEVVLRINVEKNTWSVNGQYGTSSDNIELVQRLGIADGFLAACSWISKLKDRQAAKVKQYLTLDEIDIIVNNLKMTEIL